jgi:hypothetical protein
MGKVWPQGSIAFHESTTALSNIVAISESPRWEDLLVVGTDDGLVQITEDGGRTWHKYDSFPDVPKWAYVTHVEASPIDANTIFVSFNNWQRGDYKPYIVKTTDRGKTWTNITGDLPDKRDVWAVSQDFVAPNLLFAGTEFGLYFTVDGGKKWIQLKGGMPPTQVRDLQLQKREADVVMATFGRGFWVLDDYSALREVSAQSMGEEARLYPTRDHAYAFQPWGVAQDGAAGLATLGGNFTFPNPPRGAAISYSVGSTMPDDTRLVANILDPQGNQVARLDLDKSVGFHRTMWALNGAGGGGGGRGWRRGCRRCGARPVDAAQAELVRQVLVPLARQARPAGRGAGGAGAGAAGAPPDHKSWRSSRAVGGGGRGGGGGSVESGPLSHRDRQARGRGVHADRPAAIRASDAAARAELHDVSITRTSEVKSRGDGPDVHRFSTSNGVWKTCARQARPLLLIEV